jgi:hypothetical protein
MKAKSTCHYQPTALPGEEQMVGKKMDEPSTQAS